MKFVMPIEWICRRGVHDPRSFSQSCEVFWFRRFRNEMHRHLKNISLSQSGWRGEKVRVRLMSGPGMEPWHPACSKLCLVDICAQCLSQIPTSGRRISQTSRHSVFGAPRNAFLALIQRILKPTTPMRSVLLCKFLCVQLQPSMKSLPLHREKEAML